MSCCVALHTEAAVARGEIYVGDDATRDEACRDEALVRRILERMRAAKAPETVGQAASSACHYYSAARLFT